MRTVDLEALKSVAAQLDKLERPYAFTGGIVVGFLLDHPEVVHLRPTDDLDAITSVTSYAQQNLMEEELRGLLFIHDTSEGAPSCRFLFEGIKVDVMPAKDETGQFNNPWFESALASASPRSMKDVTVNTVDAPHFIATKIAAFLDRSKGDLYSHDLEDIITVVDGRNHLVEEMANAPPFLRHFVADQIRVLMGSEAFRDALPGHLPGDRASQGRLPKLMESLRKIAAL
ncbi:MAG: hypothetical protein JJU29_10770 [Verrucomicrobia bacterium]|nr:hypothetical protein [Verrucomicrobiota bacterium]MCH8511937.1 hypothetical protein [Kiritimatiellia bacterium]